MMIHTTFEELGSSSQLSEGKVSKFNVPERYRSGLSLIPAIQEDALLALLNILADGDSSEASLKLRISEAAQHARLFMTESEALEVTSAVRSLYRLWSGLDMAVTEFTQEILDALIEEKILDGSPELKEKFSKRLLKLLDIDGLKIDVKVKDLLTEDEKIFCRGRVISDIRPVFGDDPDEAPKAYIILHHLKIIYHDDSGRHREFLVTLDSNDLSALKATVERAEKKNKTLEQLLPDTGSGEEK